VVVNDVLGGATDDVVVDRTVEVVVPVEKHDQVRPAACTAVTAAPNVSPVTFGTYVPLGKHRDHVMPTKEPFGRSVPGDNGVAPTFTWGSGPGIDND